MRTATRLRAAGTMREGSLKAYTDRIAAEIRTDRDRKAQDWNAQLGIDPIRLRTDLMRRNPKHQNPIRFSNQNLTTNALLKAEPPQKLWQSINIEYKHYGINLCAQL